MEINLENEILPVYQDYLTDYHTRTMVFYGGAGSGKSVFIAQKLAIKCDVLKKRKLLVIRKVGATLRDSVWASFVQVLTDWEMIESINKSDFTITLLSGSQILFKGLDDKEKIKSIQGITDIFIEEATELDLDDFTQLNLRLRSNEPYNQIHIAFNPIAKTNWCYKYFFENGAPDDCEVIQTTYKDNVFLPPEYINSLMELEQRNPAYYRIYALGEFATLDKLVFPIYEKKIINEKDMSEYQFWCGLDWGFTNDETAITWGYFDSKDRVIYITGEYNKKGMTNDVIYQTLEELGLAKERIICDSAEPKSIEELKKFGAKHIRGAIKGKDSVLTGIDKILRCRIVVDERCTHVIEELQNYTWKKDRHTGEYINEPIDAFNHHMDSIRYGIQDVINKKYRTEEERARLMFL